jgi:hypothetical protein
MTITGPISTPDRRVRVFVSSTLTELAAERDAARDAITGLHLTPATAGRQESDPSPTGPRG